MQSPLIMLVLFLLQAVLAWPSSSASNLTERDEDGMKDCNGGLYAGKYHEGEGSYVAAEMEVESRCWLDYFVVGESLSFTPWIKSSGNTYCTGTSQCTVASLSGARVCQKRSSSVTASMSLELEKVAKVGISTSTDVSNEKCFEATSTTTCQWSDGQCHVVWTQQELVLQQGYLRKRCDTRHGEETACMTDWTMETPTGKVSYGCGSKCEDTNWCDHTDGTPC